MTSIFSYYLASSTYFLKFSFL